MSDLMQEIRDAIRRDLAARERARRTVICEPHREQEVRAAVDQLAAADIFTVRASVACPEGRLLLIDEAAIDARLTRACGGVESRGEGTALPEFIEGLCNAGESGPGAPPCVCRLPQDHEGDHDLREVNG